MARLRIRYHIPGDKPGRWSGELRREDDIPDLGQDVEIPTNGCPRRYRVVALLFKATLAVVGIDAEVYVASSDPSSSPPPLFAQADEGTIADR